MDNEENIYYEEINPIEEIQDEEEILIDSGAARHVCPREWHPSGRLLPCEPGLILRAANGKDLKYFGQRLVRFHLTGVEDSTMAKFQAANVRRPILSVGMLAAAGHRLEFDEHGARLRHASGTMVPLKRRGALFVLPVRVLAEEIAAAIQPDVLEGAGPAAPPEPRLDEPMAAEGPQPVSADPLPASAPARPGDPTAEERERHELTHMPPAPWCEACISGRGRDACHRPVPNRLGAELPVIQMDYLFATDKKVEAAQVQDGFVGVVG